MENIISTEPEADVKMDEDRVSAYEEPNCTLNRAKSMKKKLEDTLRPDNIIVKHTDGGVRLFLNSGAYELLKIATDEFYSIERIGEIVYKKTNVQDQQGNPSLIPILRLFNVLSVPFPIHK